MRVTWLRCHPIRGLLFEHFTRHDSPLCESGAARAVTDANKDEYSSLLARFVLETETGPQLAALAAGFASALPSGLVETLVRIPVTFSLT
jgi:hypothetical protein